MGYGRGVVFFAPFCAAMIACGLGVVGTTDLAADADADADAGAVDGASSDAPTGSKPPDATIDCPLGNGRNGGLCGGTCADLATDRGNCGACGVQCAPTQACEGKCVDVATDLVALRIELPCASPSSFPLCSVTAGTRKKEVTLGGSPQTSYVLVLRFRGVVEQNSYPQTTAGAAIGENAGFFVKAGPNPVSGPANDYAVYVSAPEQNFRLNAGVAGGPTLDRIGYTARVIAKGGSTLAISADPKADGFMTRNDGIVVPDVPPAPQPFDGQFIQVDVVSVIAPTP